MLVLCTVYLEKECAGTYLHLTVDSVTAANGPAAAEATVVVAPVRAALTVGTITGHVTSVTTDATDDIGGEVALLRTVVLAVSDLTTCVC